MVLKQIFSTIISEFGSPHFPQMQENLLNDSQEHTMISCHVLSTFVIGCAREDVNFSKSYQPSFRVTEKDFVTIDIKEPTKLSRSNLLIIIFLKVCTFSSEVLSKLLHSLKFTSQQNWRLFSLRMVLITQINWTLKNFTLTKTFTTKNETVILLEIIVAYEKSQHAVVPWQNLPWSKCNSLKNHLMKPKTILTRWNCGSKKIAVNGKYELVH